jgi:hypothetical protein
MFKAAIPEKPDKVYQSVGDLFDELYFEQLAFLAFSKPAPVFTDEKRLKFSEDLWSNDVPPKLGNGRI